MSSLIEALGTGRVLEPRGALPQAARRLDATLPRQGHELELDVQMLALDSTSFRQLRESGHGDPAQIAEGIRAIVAERGKMHNPVTGSGGILTGLVRGAGAAYPDPPPVGARVVSLASLTLTPLRLQAIGELDPANPHIPVQGTAYLSWTLPWAAYPDDVDGDAALAALDVCNAATQTRSLIGPDTRTVLVLGGGHGGLLSLAAARDSLSDGAQLVLVDADARICERARSLGLCDLALRADLRDPVAALHTLTDAGVPRAELTVVVVNAGDCEAASILLTADHGTVLFFSMATLFTKAALGAEDMASTARMLVGSGYAADRGRYALELIRRDPGLQRALSHTGGQP
ncbi:MAG: L-erythro-3,5-diaminohexanoate dehydrogenase [Solirubrobacteraceae bacterium]